jgi:hypothetical protein
MAELGGVEQVIEAAVSRHYVYRIMTADGERALATAALGASALLGVSLAAGPRAQRPA